MRKEIEIAAKTITSNTKISDLIGIAETMEELSFLLQNVKSQPQNDELSDKLKERALTELKGIPKEELKISTIQKTMRIGYHNAALIYDWLREDINH